jgi:hypothetical protein
VFDTDWSKELQTSHDFADTEFEPDLVMVLEPGVYAATLHRTRLTAGAKIHFDAADLGPAWQQSEDNALPPWAEAKPEGLLLHTKGAQVHKAGKLLAPGEDVLLARGEHVDIGQARLTVTGSARVTVQARNAFGVMRVGSLQLELPEANERPAVEVVGVAEDSP